MRCLRSLVSQPLPYSSDPNRVALPIDIVWYTSPHCPKVVLTIVTDPTGQLLPTRSGHQTQACLHLVSGLWPEL